MFGLDEFLFLVFECFVIVAINFNVAESEKNAVCGPCNIQCIELVQFTECICTGSGANRRERSKEPNERGAAHTQFQLITFLIRGGKQHRYTITYYYAALICRSYEN